MMSLPGKRPDAATSPSRFAAMSPRFALSLTLSESGLSPVVLVSLGFVASVGMSSLDASVSTVPATIGSPVVSRAFASSEVAGV